MTYQMLATLQQSVLPTVDYGA